jgi:hypothetical protein
LGAAVRVHGKARIYPARGQSVEASATRPASAYFFFDRESLGAWMIGFA